MTSSTILNHSPSIYRFHNYCANFCKLKGDEDDRAQRQNMIIDWVSILDSKVIVDSSHSAGHRKRQMWQLTLVLQPIYKGSPAE